MNTFQLVAGIILLVFSVFLVIAVLMQEGKSHNLSGTIAGGADTFFGKSKGQAVSKKLSVLTSVVAIIFVILVIVVYARTDEESFKDRTVDTKIEEVADSAADAVDSTADAVESIGEDVAESVDEAVDSTAEAVENTEETTAA